MSSTSVFERLSRVRFQSITPDLSGLKDNERAALIECIHASEYITDIFLRQVSRDNQSICRGLSERTDHEGRALYNYFMIQGCPWDSFDGDEPFIEGIDKQPKGAAFYPDDLTRQEWDAYLEQNPVQKETLESPVSVVKRNGDRLCASLYSYEYRDELARARGHLVRAAALLDEGTLKEYLEQRALAFVTNDYRASDIAWIRTNGRPFGVTIGPYEQYLDGLFNLKATFESFITLPDETNTVLMQKFLPVIAPFDALLSDQYGHVPNGSHTPLEVVRDVFRAGEAAFGCQFVAHNLPNNEATRQQYGYKQVISATMMELKFNGIGLPACHHLLNPEDSEDISFVDRQLAVSGHELSHGVGPKRFMRGGEEIDDIRTALKDLTLCIEEARADTLGIRLLAYCAQLSVITYAELQRAMVTYVPIFFMGFRKGFSEAHARANLIEYNWLKDRDAILYDEKRSVFNIDIEHAIASFMELSDELIRIQISGNYDRAKCFVEQWTTIGPEIAHIIKQLRDLPIEIIPRYQLTDLMAPPIFTTTP